MPVKTIGAAGIAGITAGAVLIAGALFGGFAIVGGTALGVADAIGGKTPANCHLPPNLFDAWEHLENFLTGTPECQCSANEGQVGGAEGVGNQGEYVKSIIGVQKAMNLPERAGIIAIATALVESGLKNYANDGIYDTARNFSDATLKNPTQVLGFAKKSLDYPHDAVGSDASSVGLFQQQAWWGNMGGSTWENDPDSAMGRLMDPVYGSQKFMTVLMSIPGWESMDMGAAAQKVQVSAFPDKYAARMTEATQLYNQYKGEARDVKLYDFGAAYSGGGADSSDSSGDCLKSGPGEPGVVMDKGPLYQMTTQWMEGRSASLYGAHSGVDIDCDDARQHVYTPMPGVVTIAINGVGKLIGGDVQVKLEDGSVLRFHHGEQALVSPGDQVAAGTAVMECGDTGMSFGSHLHLELNAANSNNPAVKALPEHSSRAGNKDPILALNILGVNICPPYVEKYSTAPVGTPLGGYMKCWPAEEWVR